MATYNDKKAAIKVINEQGQDVLEIEISGESVFFLAKSFEPPVGGSVSALPYLTFTGFDITEFLVKNIYSEGNLELFRTRFEAIMRDSKDSNFKFSDNHIWRYYGLQ